MTPLATEDDLDTYNYDTEIVTPFLDRADARVRGYLSGRTSTVLLFAEGATIPIALVELVCSVANRMANTAEQVGQGVRSEMAGSESVTWGAEAYAGVSDLTTAEKATLDRLYPHLPRSVEL